MGRFALPESRVRQPKLCKNGRLRGPAVSIALRSRLGRRAFRGIRLEVERGLVGFKLTI
jgi:hypothetical protein